MREFSKLRDYEGEDSVVSSFDLKEKLKQLPPTRIVKSSLPGLEKYIYGFETGELIAISGPRKNGKTLLCQSFTYDFQEKDVHSMWFSYEVTARRFFERFEDGLPHFYLPQKLKPAAMNWLEDRIVEGLVKFGTSVVFIDHLHYLFDMAQMRSPSIQIGQIIRQLKRMAVDYNIIIFILCHFTKTVKNQADPSDEDMRDSSFISQESDTGLIIWRTPEYSNLKVCYSRRTGEFNKSVKLVKVGGRLKEMSLHDEI